MTLAVYFVVTILRIISEIAFISAKFDVGYRVAPFLCSNALFMMLFIQDLSKSCGIEVYRVEK